MRPIRLTRAPGEMVRPRASALGFHDGWRAPMDPKTNITEDALAEVNLAVLMKRRAEAVERQKEASDRVQTAKAGHFLRFWLGGGAMLLGALWLAQALTEYTPIGMFL